ncbi:MAG TPA: S8 family serine peptidase [Candidatus Tumulicola sp.]|nr:S8 family serine peptidase [Candidatus Tumulicola sp.]
MNGSLKFAAPLVAALAIAACSSGGTSNVPVASGAAQGMSVSFKHVPEWAAKHQARSVCPQVYGKPSCLALQVEKNGIVPLCSPSSGCGFTAQQLEEAYGLKAKQLAKGNGTKVAVIEAGDLANATSDLAAYRSQYNLGTANLLKYNEHGQQSNYPPSCENYGWCLETDLDIDMISASCPKCTIYLMEAGGQISDFETAEAEAVTLGATILSNSWICYGSGDCQDSNFPNYFNTPGITYLASSGDASYDNIGAPSVLDSVIAVGGTQLAVSGSKFSETVWDGAGAGCANASNVGGSGISKPSWQHDPSCSNRTDADISAEAGCSPGVAVYVGLYGGWTGVCGTSVASPLLAGIVALAGNEASLNAGQYVWSFTSKQRTARLHAIKSGSDGSCGGSYLCTAGTKQYKTYSGPGGWGTPKTIKAL